PFPPPTTLTGQRRTLSGRIGALTGAAVVLILGLALTEAIGMTRITRSLIDRIAGVGTLVVVIDDPELQVVLQEQNRGFSGVGSHEIRLPAGVYSLTSVKQVGNQGVGWNKRVAIIPGHREIVKMTLGDLAEAPGTDGWRPLFNGRDLS